MLLKFSSDVYCMPLHGPLVRIGTVPTLPTVAVKDSDAPIGTDVGAMTAVAPTISARGTPPSLMVRAALLLTRLPDRSVASATTWYAPSGGGTASRSTPPS